MLLGGKGGCQQCTCVPCDACTRTCTEPHTGDAFEVVYTRKFEGVEVGNTTDGYLTATGDSDTSDPYNGMDGSGPWFQQVGGGFNDGGSAGGGTRFPCTYRFSFWRSNYTLGASTIPPASTALTKNVITLNVSSGAVVFPDGRVITSADGVVELASIPLVSGGASAVDPRTGDGSVSFALQCQNVETLFSVQARIEWNTQKRQHVLYGIVRECYEEGTPCATKCNGGPPPDVLYLTISNFTTTAGTFGGTYPGGTYVLEREAGLCDRYTEYLDGCIGTSSVLSNFGIATVWGGLLFRNTIIGTDGCGIFIFSATDPDLGTLCGPGVIASGSREWGFYVGNTEDGVPNAVGSLDWEVSA